MPLSATRTLLCGPRYALSFDGKDDYVSIPRSESLNVKAITMMARFKANAFLPDVNPFLDRNNYYAFGLFSGQLWSWLNLPTQGRTATAVETGRWYHFAVTFGNGIRKHYLNGVLVNQWAEDATEITTYNTIRMIIGANANDTDTAESAPSMFFNGHIGEVLIYSRALSDKEILWNFNHRDNPVRNGLVLWLHWDSIDIDAGKWYDKSAFANHGTIYGATLVEPIRLKARLLSPVRSLSPAR